MTVSNLSLFLIDSNVFLVKPSISKFITSSKCSLIITSERLWVSSWEFVERYNYKDKEIFVIGEGRLVNLVASTGHPASVMDMSFANQALAAKWINENHKSLENIVYKLPKEVDEEIAKKKLFLMGGELQDLSDEQKTYLSSWEFGTS